MDLALNMISRSGAIATPKEQSKQGEWASDCHGDILQHALPRTALNTISQTSSTITGELSEMHLTAEPHADKNSHARLEILPQELVDTIVVHLGARDSGALSATSKQLDSKLFDRKFEHLDFYLCKSQQKLRDIENIISHKRFRLTVRSVTLRITFQTRGDVLFTSLRHKAEVLHLLQQAENLTHLTVKDDGEADALLPAIALPSLKELSLVHIGMDLETLIDFIKAQPKLEEVHIDGAFLQDVELGDVDQDLKPLDLGGPAIEEGRKGFRASIIIRERTVVRNISIDEGSDRLREPWFKLRRKSQKVFWNGSRFVKIFRI